MDEFFKAIGDMFGAAEDLGVTEAAAAAFGGGERANETPSRTETYDRVLTRQRELTINDL